VLCLLPAGGGWNACDFLTSAYAAAAIYFVDFEVMHFIIRSKNYILYESLLKKHFDVIFN
jgi:hypothetical protein